MGLTIITNSGKRIRSSDMKKVREDSGKLDTDTDSYHQMELRQKIRNMSQDSRKQLARLLTPRVVEEFMPHVPHPTQQVFMSLNNRETLFGGSAGAGKSDSLLMSALQFCDVPGYSALILRRTYADLVLPGAIMDRAATWWRDTRAKPINGGTMWRFPSGARITFGYLQHSNDKYRYASSEYQGIFFDELTQFPEDDYTFLFSRLRKPRLICMLCQKKIVRAGMGSWYHESTTSCPYPTPDVGALEEYRPAPDGMRIYDVPLRMKSASNPGGRGNDWVRDRFVNPETRYPGALFVPSSLADNPSLDRKEYEESLSHLSVYDRQRLLNGDWDVVEAGGMFQREWWGTARVDEVPKDATTLRFWDLAASKNGDYTVGLKMAEKDGRFWIVDIQRDKLTPMEVENLVQRTAERDGPRTRIVIEQEPGSAGVSLIDYYRRRVLLGYFVKPDKPSADKVTRATPFSSAAEAGNIYLVLSRWTSAFMDECSVFPNGDHDDQVDAAAGAHRWLARVGQSKIIA